MVAYIWVIAMRSKFLLAPFAPPDLDGIKGIKVIHTRVGIWADEYQWGLGKGGLISAVLS